MITRSATVTVNPRIRRQTIDGFGVNINGRYWGGGTLAAVLDLLVDDLGATLFRLDIYGKSNWIDPTGERGRENALDRANLDSIYAGPVFQSGLATALHLNKRGIEPYVTLSGIVPPWMCSSDGVTLTDMESYCTMATDYVSWLRRNGVRFSLFGPQNETNLGPPEGPRLGPAAFVELTRTMARHFDAAGLGDIRFVVAEQAGVGHDFLEAFNNAPDLRGRIGALGMHTYFDPVPVADVVGRWKAGPHQAAPVWMTEYGDLDQSGEQELYFSHVILRRLFFILREGMSAALNWDAFDNYHDHDEAWTLYGLIRTGLRTFTPKKRFHACKHVYRFARPGCALVDSSSDTPSLDVIAFEADGALTVVGINNAPEAIRLIVRPEGMKESAPGHAADAYVTTDLLNCAHVTAEPFRPWTGESLGWQVEIPGSSIVTVRGTITR